MWSKCLVFLLILIFESRLTNGQLFRKDYKFIEEVNSFYKINVLPKTWSQAKFRCMRDNADLFYPEDEEEAEAVISWWNLTQSKIPETFIGVADWNVKGIFETVDGRRISHIYDNWAYGEPNNEGGNSSCVVMQKDGALKDENCDSKYPYICKKPLGQIDWNYDCNLPDPAYKYNKALDRCYKFHLTPKNWTDAYLKCNSEQSYLAIINSREEDEYLVNITAEAPKDTVQGYYLRGVVHVGFHNRQGIWETIKGVPLDVSGFGDGWGNMQPDGASSKEDCGSMFYTGQLNDISCGQVMFFICEHEMQRPKNSEPNITD